jgi:hypothetical protein
VFKLLLGVGTNECTSLLAGVLREAGVGETQAIVANKLAIDLVSGLVSVSLPETWTEELNLSVMEDDETTSNASTGSAIDYLPKARVVSSDVLSGQPRRVSKAEVAWRMLYKETYQSEDGVRPGHHGVFRVKLTKNQRLTPLEYHRNVFHLEME